MQTHFTPYEGNGKYIFVSYSHLDSDKVAPILDKLSGNGLRIWFDEGIEWGSEWPETIASHLRRCEVCMVFHSKSSVNSQNCRQEIYYALKNKKGILSVYLEPVELSDGIDMQLSPFQSTFLYKFDNLATFHNRLASTSILQSCKTASSTVSSSAPSNTAGKAPSTSSGSTSSKASVVASSKTTNNTSSKAPVIASGRVPSSAPSNSSGNASGTVSTSVPSSAPSNTSSKALGTASSSAPSSAPSNTSSKASCTASSCTPSSALSNTSSKVSSTTSSNHGSTTVRGFLRIDDISTIPGRGIVTN